MIKNYYTSYNGVSVPSGNTEQYIENVLCNNKYGKLNITENDGSSDDYIYLGIYENKHKFKRIFNKNELFLKITDIHLIKEI